MEELLLIGGGRRGKPVRSRRFSSLLISSPLFSSLLFSILFFLSFLTELFRYSRRRPALRMVWSRVFTYALGGATAYVVCDALDELFIYLHCRRYATAHECTCERERVSE